MRVGVDFDNTIVRYDEAFHRIALEQGLIPADLPPFKGAVRDYLRRADREDDWTRLQGCVYGPRMTDAQPFPGALEFFARCADLGVETAVISHRTLRPYLGPPYDLHQAARDWMVHYGFYDRTGLRPENVFYELTLAGKIARIAAVGCDVFIDDLPEFLELPEFPARTRRILFDPNDRYSAETRFERRRTWAEIADLILGGEPGRGV